MSMSTAIGSRENSAAAIIGPDRIAELAQGYRAAKALFCAVELGLFTVLARNPRDLEALRVEIGIAERGARDFLDALVALGLLDRDNAGCYRNTPVSNRYLDASRPPYLGDDLAHLNARGYPHWHHLTAALRSGRPQAEAGAEGYFRTLYRDGALLETFTRGMAGGTRLAAQSMAEQFPWREYRTVIDIGTAAGCLPVQVARTHPHITGGGFDLPELQDQFDRYVREHDLSHRLRFYPGDFFHDPLPRADVLVFGRVLHNWDLATKKMLLRKAHDALPVGGVVVVYERLIDDDRRAKWARRAEHAAHDFGGRFYRRGLYQLDARSRVS